MAHELETARLRLRRPVPADLDGYVEAWGDPEVTRYLPGGRPRTREQVAAGLERLIEHWDRHGFGFWSLLFNGTGAWLGYCGLQYLPEGDEVELAYGLARPHWGKGLTTEAARAAVRYGFEQLKLDRIVALAVHEHVASRWVMDHAGMRYGKDTHAFGLDAAYHAIDRADWQPRDDGYVLWDGPPRA